MFLCTVIFPFYFKIPCRSRSEKSSWRKRKGSSSCETERTVIEREKNSERKFDCQVSARHSIKKDSVKGVEKNDPRS